MKLRHNNLYQSVLVIELLKLFSPKMHRSRTFTMRKCFQASFLDLILSRVEINIIWMKANEIIHGLIPPPPDCCRRFS